MNESKEVQVCAGEVIDLTTAETGKVSSPSTSSVSAREVARVKRVLFANMPLAPEAICVGEEHHGAFREPPATAAEAAVVGTSKKPRNARTVPGQQDHTRDPAKCFGLIDVLEENDSPSAAHDVTSGTAEAGATTVSMQLDDYGDEIELLLMPFPDVLLKDPGAQTFLLRVTAQATASHLSAYLVTKLLPKDVASLDPRSSRDAYRLHAAIEKGDILVIPGGMTMEEAAEVFQNDGTQLELYYSRRLE